MLAHVSGTFHYHISDLQQEDITAIREAKILTEISLGEDGSVSVGTSNAESDDPPNVVTFSPSVSTNITNPLNGEQVEVGPY